MVKTTKIEQRKGNVLLIIDVQRGLFNRASPVYEAEALIQNINSLVDRAHESGAPVYYIQHSNNSSLVKDTEEWKLHSAMRPTDLDEVIHKKHGSAFVETSLGEELASKDVGKLTVTGLVTQGCVMATCLDALKLGYAVDLVEDAHSTYNRTAKKTIRQWNRKLSDSGAVLLRADEVFFG